MTFESVSGKQKQVFQWWNKTDYKAIICDGAVRSGKTMCMVTSFIYWAMRNFNGCNFGICGKTVASSERNIVRPLSGIADLTHYYKIKYLKGTHLLIIESKSKKYKTINNFWIFGGKDESSYTLLQGITLSGIFLDEVALMPESFVNQAIARTLSEEKAKYWFNCNPESPAHWFYNDWIMQAEERNALHLHFLMSDNPVLSQEQLDEAKRQFNGVFYERYVLGLWVAAEGLIYPMYEKAIEEPPIAAEGERCIPQAIHKVLYRAAEQYVLSIDYGTLNAFACLLWGKYGNVWYAIDGYYYSGRDQQRLLTDDEYADRMDEQFGNIYATEWNRIKTIIDPSAASFTAALRRRKLYHVVPADNAVLDGIRETASAMQQGFIKINPSIKEWKQEVEGYVWDNDSAEDRPIKLNDHYMDCTRYFVHTMRIVKKGERKISR